MTTTPTTKEKEEESMLPETSEQGPSVWLVTRAEDPGAIPCEDEATARTYAETRYREDDDPDVPGILRWDDDGELVDETLPGSYQGTGWTVREERVVRATDLPTTVK